MAIVNGTDLRIWIDGTAIGYATSCTFDGSTAMTEVIHKDSVGNFADKSPSTQSWTMSTEGFTSYDVTINGNTRKGIDYLRSAWLNRTRLYVQWTSSETGKGTLNGYAYITSHSESGAANEEATYSTSFEGDGAISIGTET